MSKDSNDTVARESVSFNPGAGRQVRERGHGLAHREGARARRRRGSGAARSAHART